MKQNPLVVLIIAILCIGCSPTTKPKGDSSTNQSKSLPLRQKAAATNSQNGRSSPLRPRVRTVKIKAKFLVYVGGGANISPPDTYGGGDGIPAISMSDNGVFMAGELKAEGDGLKLIMIVCDFKNRLPQIESFKLGDIALIVGQARSNDFLAVGYDSKLCGISHEYRDSVKKIVVEVPANGTKTLSFIFALTDNDAKQGGIVIGGSPPALFQINPKVYK